MRLIPGFWDYTLYVLVALAASAVLALVLTPLVRRIAVRLDNIDRPDPRRVNQAPVPRGGGIAVAAAFLLTALGWTGINASQDLVRLPSSLGAQELGALLAGGALATVWRPR